MRLGYRSTGSPPPGSRAEFDDPLEQDFPALAAQLYVITRNARQARELVQDAYAEAWRQ